MIEPLEWLYGMGRFGMKLGLERIRAILKELENPQENYEILHVGGTNGKGSVCHFLGNVLKEAGYKTGVYISPHLQDYSERIAINGKRISKKDLSRILSRIRAIVEKMDIEATFFEISTALAFQYFYEKRVDFAVIEVGLGGKLDATNVVNSLVSIVTNVELEHTDVLGNKIEEIAIDKASIIKNRAVTASKGRALRVLKDVCNKIRVPLKIVGEDIKWKRIKKKRFIIEGDKNYEIATILNGEYQGENIANVIAAIEFLEEYGFNIPKDAIHRGIYDTILPGRLELNGNILLDGAHNPAGMLSLKKALGDFDYDELIILLGILKDKDISKMVKIIVPMANHIIITKVKNPRGCEPEKIAREAELVSTTKIIIKETVPESIEFARSISNKNDLICICGSLYLVGEARNYLGLK